ncbi:hypothetical protein M441DRAFT_65206 [Trichoderma asperellum CBS 433.97]|uniref:CFEM domain-containing protein n=2 Tax=Trichoderma asperellum TaxID=101201 RepID=A0A2T3ZL73_TRIA4|nr:hypothetical protein M441DRAFT_65206 [Trichoderma asperellum CBS 433.97]PTB45546.1 hypothetical protein M441DRAFT_65206 [Trichoderma asperellum CBS 433.97]
MKLNIIISTFLLSSSTLAQSLSGLPTCAATCALNAVGATGCAATDASCICMAASFLASIQTCISSACNASDQAATLSFAQQFCASAGVTITLPAAALPAQTSSTSSALQATPQQSVTEAPAAIPTTLVTTTDSAGNVYTVTGEVLISGNSTTTVPCRTVITTNAAGVTITSTETGSSVLPTALQGTTPASTAKSSTTAIVTGAAQMLNWSRAAFLSIGLSGISIVLVLLF